MPLYTQKGLLRYVSFVYPLTPYTHYIATNILAAQQTGDSSLNLILLPLRTASTDNATSRLPLDAALHADVLVEDEAPDGIHPALVAGQVAVELVGDAADGVEPGPGHGGEVVVLVVETDVVGEPVERAVVGEGLGDGHAVARVALGGRDGLVDVVLGDEVSRERVQAAGKEGREQEVEDRGAGGEAVEEHVDGELDGDVEGVHPGEGDAVDGHGADGVEEDLEGAEEGLAENGVEHEGFESSGEICIEAIDAEGLVVGQMVGLSS